MNYFAYIKILTIMLFVSFFINWKVACVIFAAIFLFWFKILTNNTLLMQTLHGKNTIEQLKTIMEGDEY